MCLCVSWYITEFLYTLSDLHLSLIFEQVIQLNTCFFTSTSLNYM